MTIDQKLNPVSGPNGMRYSWGGPAKDWAREAGREDTGSQWILTPHDVWEENPHYQGPDQPHPEEHCEELAEVEPRDEGLEIPDFLKRCK